MHPKDKRIIIAGCILVGGLIAASLVCGYAFIYLAFPANMTLAGLTIVLYLWCYDVTLKWVDQDLPD